VSLLQTGGNREGLSAAALSNFMILYPSTDEQIIIASFLDNKCAEIDALIALKQQKIETLKDYKKSLIYEAVTGKLEI
jgi:type I restriction enzyme S subunit